MKKLILVPRGPKQNTLFSLNGRRVDMKPLYKAFTDPTLYANRLGYTDVEVCTKEVESPFLLISSTISVNNVGQCKLRADIRWEDGTQQRISVEFEVTTAAKKITTADVNRVLDSFFEKFTIPEFV